MNQCSFNSVRSNFDSGCCNFDSGCDDFINELYMIYVVM